MVNDFAETLISASEDLLAELVVSHDGQVEGHGVVLVQVVHGHADESVKGWQSVSKGSKNRMRVECVIFCQRWGHEVLFKLDRPQEHEVRLRVVGEAGAFNEDVGSTGERDPVKSGWVFTLESCSFRLLKSLFSITNSIKVVATGGSLAHGN